MKGHAMSWRTSFFTAVVGTSVFMGSVALADVTPGALIDLDADWNAGAAANQWTNNGSLGGQFIWATSGGGSAPIRAKDDTATYYSSSGSSWATAASTFTQGSPTVPFVDFSVEVWLKRLGDNPAGGEHHLLGLADNQDAGKRFHLVFGEGPNGDNNGVDVMFRGTGNPMSKHFDAVTVADGEWNQLVFTFDNDTKKFDIYQNGVNVLSTTESGINMDDGKEMGVFSILKLGGDEPDSRVFNGLISRLRIYDWALSSTQVEDNFAFGNSAIPEPGSIALWGAALVALTLRRRRPRKVSVLSHLD